MKKIATICLVAFLVVAAPLTVFAGAFVEIKPLGWFYDYGESRNGSRYAKNAWIWIPDSSNQRVMYCYYFGADGRMYQNQITPDGYQVDATGAWVQNGVKQWKLNEQYGNNKIPVYDGNLNDGRRPKYQYKYF